MVHGMVKVQFLVLLLSVAVSAGQSSGMWLDVPFVKQKKNGCGAATIAMVMEYWRQQPGDKLPAGPAPQQILDDLYAKEAGGIYASEMESYFRQHGFQAFTFQGRWDDIEQHLGKGRPLIVALQPGSRSPRHYVVVVGLDEEQGVVLTNDPAERKLLKQARTNFEEEWKAAGNWTLLAVPQGSERSSSR
jgi:ABC-type bacteriocin/lantibiotic exporter with double-glycine peptidase domain